MDLRLLQAEEITEKDIIIRQSTINSMQLCPAREGLKGKPGYIEPVGESLVVGTVPHYLIAMFLGGETVPVTNDAADELFNQIIQEQYDWTIDQIPNWPVLRNEMLQIYSTWMLQVWKQDLFEKLRDRRYYVEEDIHVLLETWRRKKIILRGTPDLAVPGLGVYDWKTTAAAKKWTQQKADLSIQASLYLGLHNIRHPDEQVYDFTFYVFDRKDKLWFPVRTSRTQQHVDAAFETARMYGRQLATGVFPATPRPHRAGLGFAETRLVLFCKMVPSLESVSVQVSQRRC